MTIGKRILELRGKLSRRAFAKRIGIVENTLRNYEEGLSLPNSDVIAAICREFNISAEWLVLGEQREMGTTQENPNDETKKLELKIRELEDALIAAQAEAIRAYKLATTRMQPESDILQKPDSIKVEHAPVKQIYSESRADEKL